MCSECSRLLFVVHQSEGKSKACRNRTEDQSTYGNPKVCVI